jgi:isoleucyl-tRNA synthetase
VKLGHAARQAAAVKVRQPLPGLLVYTRESHAFDAVQRLSDLILDELNVKEIRPLTDPGDVVAYNVRPNLSLLGPKYGKRLSGIRQALAAADAADVARHVEAGQPVTLDLPDGSSVSLALDELLVDLAKQPGYAAAQGDVGTVVLDTSLTPELIDEGLARDFVRGVQDARKRAAYEIEDRITLTYDADPSVASALETFKDVIAAETLAVDVRGQSDVGISDAVEPEATDGPGGKVGTDGWYRDQVAVGGHQVRIAIQQAASVGAPT